AADFFGGGQILEQMRHIQVVKAVKPGIEGHRKPALRYLRVFEQISMQFAARFFKIAEMVNEYFWQHPLFPRLKRKSQFLVGNSQIDGHGGFGVALYQRQNSDSPVADRIDMKGDSFVVSNLPHSAERG